MTRGMINLRKIKIGIIGAGFIGPVHVESIRRLGFVDVIGVSTVSKEETKKAQEMLTIQKGYDDYHDLIADNEVEVVQIATPNYTHFPQIKAALEAGKHVICDKPLTMNAKESKILVDLAKKKGVVNAVTFNHRFYPMVQQMKAMCKKDSFGSMFFVRGGFTQDWLLYDTDYNWRVESDKGGKSRAVGDLGTHWLDTVHYITGLKVKSVFADLATFIPIRKKPKSDIFTFAGKELKPTDYEERKIDTEDYSAVLLKFFDTNTRGVMLISQVSAGKKCSLELELYGSKSSAAWDSERCNELWVGYRDKANELMIKDPSIMEASAKQYARYPGGHEEGFPDSHTQCNRAIYEYIRDEKYKEGIKPEFATFQDGHNEQLICDAILESNQKIKWIDIQYN
jgi:predicted dehydrogenase